MKKVIVGEELKEKMKLAVNLLCDTVKTTLGPKGCNSIIDHSLFSPFITNDGVTIASNIESEDEAINTILNLAKEASIKTNELVGDGTTTTLVLLQNIYNNGLDMINDGYSPILLKEDLNKSLNNIIEKIKKYSRKPTNKELINIAKISSNSYEIGEMVGLAYLKVKNKNAISIVENNLPKTEIILKKGYIIDSLLASNYFLKDKNEIELKDVYILIVNSYIDNIETISNLVNWVINNKLNLLILADDYSDDFINQVVSLYLENNINIILSKIPEIGKNKIDLLKDIGVISSATLKDIDRVTIDDLGFVRTLKIDSNDICFTFYLNSNIRKYIKILKESKKNVLDIDYFNKRIAMLNKGLIEIKVGASTDTERKEKKMRFDDALWSISSSNNGILPGSGLILYKISEELTNSVGDILFKKVLKAPLNQIIYNAGLDESNIIREIKKSNFEKIYNVKTNKFENILDSEVIDSKDVVINSLINAVSISSMLLTTNSLIINEYKNNINKENNFVDL